MLYHEINKLIRAEAKKKNEKTVETVPASKLQLQAIEADVSSDYTQEEKNILKTLIRFGTKKMKKPDDNEKRESPDDKGGSEELIVAGDFIFHEINLNQLTFETPAHQQMLEEYEEHYQDENFDAEKYFLHHPNPDIVRLTTDLVTEKYTLSKIHNKVMQSSESEEHKLCDLMRVIMNIKQVVDGLDQKIDQFESSWLRLKIMSWKMPLCWSWKYERKRFGQTIGRAGFLNMIMNKTRTINEQRQTKEANKNRTKLQYYYQLLIIKHPIFATK